MLLPPHIGIDIDVDIAVALSQTDVGEKKISHPLDLSHMFQIRSKILNSSEKIVAVAKNLR